MSTIASHSPLNILETVRLRGSVPSKAPPIGNCLWGIQWSSDQWRQVTAISKTRESSRRDNDTLEPNVSKTSRDAI